MSSDSPLAAAILFGGAARRLGGIDKSGLTIGGRSILQRILNVIGPVASHVFAVGDRFGAAARAGLPVHDDLVSDAGPLAGIYSAIVQSPCERTLVVGCDMPFVSRALVARLATLDGDVVIPRDASGLQPLCAIYTRACAAPLRDRIARGERHASQVPDGVRVVEIGPGELAEIDPEGVLFVNVNTPHEYERARKIEEAGRRPA